MTGDASPRTCPRCGEKLLWNGRGMACIACSYFSPAASKSPSEKKMSPAKRKKPGGDSKA